MVKVNVAGVEVREFTAVPKGLYRGVFQSFDPNYKAASSGDTQYLFQFKIAQTPAGAEKHKGQNILHGCSLGETSKWNLRRTLAAIGVKEEELDDPNFDFDADKYMGAEVDIRVDVRTYEGKERNQVKQIERAGSAAMSGAAKSSVPF